MATSGKRQWNDESADLDYQVLSAMDCNQGMHNAITGMDNQVEVVAVEVRKENFPKSHAKEGVDKDNGVDRRVEDVLGGLDVNEEKAFSNVE